MKIKNYLATPGDELRCSGDAWSPTFTCGLPGLRADGTLVGLLARGTSADAAGCGGLPKSADRPRPDRGAEQVAHLSNVTLTNELIDFCAQIVIILAQFSPDRVYRQRLA